jgi:hypothetical protein
MVSHPPAPVRTGGFTSPWEHLPLQVSSSGWVRIKNFLKFFIGIVFLNRIVNLEENKCNGHKIMWTIGKLPFKEMLAYKKY